MASETIQYQWSDPDLKKSFSLAAPLISACDIAPLDAWDTFLPVVREPHGRRFGHIGIPTLSDGGVLRMSARVKLLAEDQQSFAAGEERMPEGEMAEYIQSRQIRDTALPLLAQKIEGEFVRHILQTATPWHSRDAASDHSLDSLADKVMNPSRSDEEEPAWSYDRLTFLCHPLSMRHIAIPKWAEKRFRPESAPPSVIATPHMPPPSKTHDFSIPFVVVLCMDITGLIFFMPPPVVTAVRGSERWEIEASARCVAAICDFARPQPAKTELLEHSVSHSRT